MSWAKLCDSFWRNTKVMACEPATIGFFACCLSYCGDQMNDGLLPKRRLNAIMVTSRGRQINRQRACRQLVDAGLFEDEGEFFRLRNWLAHNPSRQQLRRRRAAAAIRGAVVPLRTQIMQRDKGKCRYCGCTPAKVHIDHIQPVSRGGRSTLDNLVVACAPCNLAKGASEVAKWRV